MLHNNLPDGPSQKSISKDHEDKDLEIELASAQVELSEISATLEATINKIQYLKKCINIRDSPIIQKLPPEIIAEILKQSISPFAPFDVTVDRFFPFKLAAVCALWRKTALKTPALWTCISILVTKSNASSIVALLDLWLARSGTVLPLSIRLMAADVEGWREFTPQDILQILGRHSTRWLDLDLFLPCGYSRFLPTGSNALPRLSSLSIWPNEGQETAHECLKIANAPRLTHVALTSVHLLSVDIQWENVTHLTLERFYMPDCLLLLRQTPQLVDGTFINLLSKQLLPPDSPITLPVLKYLNIRSEMDDPSQLFRTIVIPKTTDFCYTSDTILNCLDVDNLVSLLSRSECNLKTASFYCEGSEDVAVLVGLFRPLTRVNNLSLVAAKVRTPTDVVLVDDLLALFHSSHGINCLLPSLEHLFYTGPYSFSWPVLLDILESRFEISPSLSPAQPSPKKSIEIVPIRRVELNLFGYTDPTALDTESLARFVKLIEKGLHIDVRTMSNRDLALSKAGWKKIPIWNWNKC